jgi:S-adenosylmethionine synthetase
VRMTISNHAIMAVERQEFEVVERKGIGHPDSLADLIAEEFSFRYSRFGCSELGVVPNHWVDKVALIGAASAVGFGHFEIMKPVRAYLFGKVTTAVGPHAIPVTQLFRESAEHVLQEATRRPDLLNCVEFRTENSSGTAADHPHGFYRPDTADECQLAPSDRRANDTAFCVAYAPVSRAEILAIDIENFVNGTGFAASFPMIGTDAKVMIFRNGPDLDVTVCLPFHPELVHSLDEYREALALASGRLSQFVETHLDEWPGRGLMNLACNTKDAAGGAYLAPFGTSLGKGDCGLVGRGNRTNGVIPAVRPASVEAFAGKNPIHHSGKLYALAATRIADHIHDQMGLANEVVLVSRNGDPLAQPAFTGIRLAGAASAAQRIVIAGIADEVLAGMELLSKWLLETPPLERFRDPLAVLET